MVTPRQYRGSQKQKEIGRIPGNENYSAHLGNSPHQEGKRNQPKKRGKRVEKSGVTEEEKLKGAREHDSPGYTHYDYAEGTRPQAHRDRDRASHTHKTVR